MSAAFEPELAAHGWTAALDDAFRAHRAAGLIPGRVIQVDRGRCELITGEGRLHAETRTAEAPCTGDWGGVLRGDPDALTALLPRSNAVQRSASSGRSEPQVLAANVDVVVLVFSLAARVDLNRAERLLALAWESGAQPLIVLTKADLLPDHEEARSAVATAAPGVDVLPVSAHTGEAMDVLSASLSGTAALVGPSGAGKSSLVNALLGDDRLAVGEVRSGDRKGRHTTARRELVPIPGGGVLIDTPGLRGIALWDAGEGVQHAFPDIAELARRCRFRDCAHEAEPDCAVLAAVEDGELPQRRLRNYRKLLRENEWIASRSDARVRAERANRYRELSKQQRRLYRSRRKP